MEQNDRIQLWEFVRPGWTYHAKGLWYSLPGQQKPSFTLIGSPNFGMCNIKIGLINFHRNCTLVMKLIDNYVANVKFILIKDFV